MARNRDHSWRDRAECAKEGMAYMYPFESDDVGVEEAKAVCNRCPVRDECLDFALEIREQFGVWGGTTPNERRAILRKRARIEKLERELDTPTS